MGIAQRPLPQPTASTQAFWDATRQDRLLIQQCKACSTLQFYPRPFCRACLSEDTGWMESAGLGVIYTFTINHRAANEHMKPHVPYAVAVVTLDEGVKLMGAMAPGRLADIRIGARVKVVFEKVSDALSLPRFALLETA
ncbi:MAG: Zn-ribbon domain-containing OB-fold protein [Polaromonas sp.]|jgi:uncharacterized OB-fold protein|nr:Zn-ribbon domain-containing OB-fold protein [Polaromonas sp.]